MDLQHGRFSAKMYVKMKDFGPVGGGACARTPPPPPLDPPMTSMVIHHMQYQCDGTICYEDVCKLNKNALTNIIVSDTRYQIYINFDNVLKHDKNNRCIE